VRSLLDLTGMPPGRTLDAGCGNGRHLLALRDQGLSAFGCDLSAHLLKTAATRGPVFRCDLRSIPLATGSCGLVASFFTGFGYLERRSDDIGLLAELARLVAPGGWLHLDLPDPDHVRAHLVVSDEQRWSDALVTQKRIVHGDLVAKLIRIERDDGTHSEYLERVRLWNPEHLEVLARRLGFKPKFRLGDERGTPWTQGSVRCGLVLRRER